MRDYREYTLWNAVTPQTVTSSTDATPIVVTKVAHGYSTGDVIIIYGHTTNIAANGVRKITKLTANTFSIQDPYTGADIVGSGGGAGASGIMVKASAIPLVEEYRRVFLQVNTTGSFNGTILVAGSQGKLDGSSPTFGATISPSNPYSYLQLTDTLNEVTPIAGGTGIASAGTDINKIYSVDVGAVKYVTVIPTAWSVGVITVKMFLGHS